MNSADLKQLTDPSLIQERTKKRTEQLVKMGFELKLDTYLSYIVLMPISDLETFTDEEWEKAIAFINSYDLEKFPHCLDKFFERPLTQEDAFEPETNPNEIEVIEYPSEIEQPNVIDEEQTPYNVLTMTFEEKQKALTDWISNREEYELDALIEQYLN